MFISRPFGNLLDLLSVGDLYFVFAHGAHKSVGKKIFFLLSGWKKLFHIKFDGSVQKPETKTFFFLGLSCMSFLEQFLVRSWNQITYKITEKKF